MWLPPQKTYTPPENSLPFQLKMVPSKFRNLFFQTNKKHVPRNDFGTPHEVDVFFFLGGDGFNPSICKNASCNQILTGWLLNPQPVSHLLVSFVGKNGQPKFLICQDTHESQLRISLSRRQKFHQLGFP